MGRVAKPSRYEKPLAKIALFEGRRARLRSYRLPPEDIVLADGRIAIAPNRTRHRAADLRLRHAPKSLQQFGHRHLREGDIDADGCAPGPDTVIAAGRLAHVVEADINSAPCTICYGRLPLGTH